MRNFRDYRFREIFERREVVDGCDGDGSPFFPSKSDDKGVVPQPSAYLILVEVQVKVSNSDISVDDDNDHWLRSGEAWTESRFPFSLHKRTFGVEFAFYVSLIS